jgi:hypothetical protein
MMGERSWRINGVLCTIWLGPLRLKAYHDGGKATKCFELTDADDAARAKEHVLHLSENSIIIPTWSITDMGTQGDISERVHDWHAGRLMTARARGLAEFHTPEEIREMWRQVLTASMERVAVNIHVNASSKPDGRASSGINLATAAEQEAFMADCSLALESIEARASVGPRHADFSAKLIRV